MVSMIVVVDKKQRLVAPDLRVVAIVGLINAIAVAVGKSKAEKILIPSNKCKIIVAGMHDLTLGEAINQAVQTVLNYKNEK